MAPTGPGGDLDQGQILPPFDHLILGLGRFPLIFIDPHPARAVLPDGPVNDSRGLLHIPPQQGKVRFGDPAVFEFEVEEPVGLGGLGEDQQAADFLIETMDHQQLLADGFFQSLLDAGPLGVESLGDRGDPDRLVDKYNRFVFHKDLQGDLLLGQILGRSGQLVKKSR